MVFAVVRGGCTEGNGETRLGRDGRNAALLCALPMVMSIGVGLTVVLRFRGHFEVPGTHDVVFLSERRGMSCDVYQAPLYVDIVSWSYPK